MDFKKTCAFAVVAMFCITAFAAVAATDDSSADTVKIKYKVLLDFNDGTNTYVKWFEQEVEAASATDYSSENFKKAFDAIAEKEGFTVTYDTYGMVQSVKIKDVTYSKGTWGEDPYYGYAMYAAGENNKWIDTDYSQSATLAVVFDKYLFAEPADKDAYLIHDQYPPAYWTKLPSKAPSTADEKNDNMMLYIGIGAVAIIVIAALAFFLIRRKA